MNGLGRENKKGRSGSEDGGRNRVDYIDRQTGKGQSKILNNTKFC